MRGPGPAMAWKAHIREAMSAWSKGRRLAATLAASGALTIARCAGAGKTFTPTPGDPEKPARACLAVDEATPLAMRLSPVVMPCLLSILFSKSGPFPRPALPGVFSRTGLSATLPARPAPRGVPVDACASPHRASRVATIPLFHACRRHYPGGTGRCSFRSLPGRWQPSPK